MPDASREVRCGGADLACQAFSVYRNDPVTGSLSDMALHEAHVGGGVPRGGSPVSAADDVERAGGGGGITCSPPERVVDAAWASDVPHLV